jgi:ABC-type multidrug transport system fused ATPase/permease subunit
MDNLFKILILIKLNLKKVLISIPDFLQHVTQLSVESVLVIKNIISQVKLTILVPYKIKVSLLHISFMLKVLLIFLVFFFFIYLIDIFFFHKRGSTIFKFISFPYFFFILVPGKLLNKKQKETVKDRGDDYPTLMSMIKDKDEPYRGLNTHDINEHYLFYDMAEDEIDEVLGRIDDKRESYNDYDRTTYEFPIFMFFLLLIVFRPFRRHRARHRKMSVRNLKKRHFWNRYTFKMSFFEWVKKSLNNFYFLPPYFVIRKKK